jgi:hypothetical protein
LINRKCAVGPCFNMKVGNASVLFIEEIQLAGKSMAGVCKVLGLITSVDYFHVHPSEYCFVLVPKLMIYLLRSPLREAG